MDLSSPNSTPNSPLTPVFGDNVQDLLGTGTLNVNPSAIITVNSIADTVDDPSSGVTTLRDAINQANADNGQDLIVFDRSVFSNAQTITLSGTELDITHSLDIVAPLDTLTGGDLVTVSGNQASRVLEIGTGASVNIDGLIVADGKVTGDNGGGINNSGTLTLDSSIVRNNDSTSVFSTGQGAVGGLGGGIYSTGTVKVSNSTINGNSSSSYSSGGIGSGGGIYNSGTSMVDNSTISGNSANQYGGGIYNGGTLEVNSSTISDNKVIGTGGDGGGILNIGTSMVVDNSTISGNSATQDGGGICNNRTSMVDNSTINNNSSGRSGGGIYNAYSGTLTLLFATVTQNIAANGGDVYQSDVRPVFFLPLSPLSNFTPTPRGSFNVRNTIIASNFNSENGVTSDVSGTFTSNGYNLIGDATGSTGFGVTGDIVGTTDNPIDPLLAPLAFNGGSTQTVALQTGSPAIGAGDPTVLDTDPTTDQRGLPRRAADGSTDIGAFEFST